MTNALRQADVAVVLVTRNGGTHLGAQLISIRAQSVAPDVVFWVDDRSTDSSVEVVRAFFAEWEVPLVEVEPPEPSGDVHSRIAKNFEAGLRAAANCRTIVLSDQDDVWEPNRIEQHCRRLEAALMTTSDGHLIDGDGNPLNRTLRSRFPVAASWEGLSSAQRLESVLRQSMATGAASAISGDLLPHALPIPRGWLHDRWLSLVAAARGELDVDPAALVRYRVYPGQVVGLNGKLGLQGAPRVLDSLRKPVRNVIKFKDLTGRLRKTAADDVAAALRARAILRTYIAILPQHHPFNIPHHQAP